MLSEFRRFMDSIFITKSFLIPAFHAEGGIFIFRKRYNRNVSENIFQKS